MAKVKFGSGTKVAVEPMKTMKTPVLEQHKVIDPSAIKEAIMAELPKYDDTFGSALRQLRDELQQDMLVMRKEADSVRVHVESMEDDVDALFDKVKAVEDEVESMPEPQAPALVHPEVKQITHVKDVSKEVMEHVEANHKKHDGDLMCHANHIVAIEAKLRTQKVLNCLLFGAVILTILSRFI